jgi:uncharacterized protein (TIGR03000 family)
LYSLEVSEMYSVVMMMALTTGGEMPAWGDGCYGCSGYCSGYCSGSSCHGCWSSCHGGCWSSCHGCHGGFGLFNRGCHGCHSSCNGCSSSCHGCHGGFRLFNRGCHGCHGCHDSCHGYVSYGCCGCCGTVSYGCNGCNGSNGCWNGGCAGAVVVPPAAGTQGTEPGKAKVPAPTPDEDEKDEKAEKSEKGDKAEKGEKGDKGGKDKGKKAAPEEEETSTGTIQVSLPAEAQLTVDGQQTTSTSTRRTFVSPNLQPGYQYFYTLRATMTRDGQALTQTQRVAVRPGQVTRISFDFSPSGVAANR